MHLATIFEELGQANGPAVAGVAAVLVGRVDGAGVVAAAGCPELVGAFAHDVGSAPDHSVAARHSTELHGNVESIHERGCRRSQESANCFRAYSASVLGGWP
ncbi:hypothetical protein ACLOJK_021393 [Asimina triloba]